MKTLTMMFSAAMLLIGMTVSPASAEEPVVSLKSLLHELIDYDHLARWPEPAFTCRQASSYDRASKTPEDKEGWFANGDQNQWIREEKNGDRTEKVMMDADGPGAIVRFWITSGDKKHGKIRIYLDGGESPLVTIPSYDFTNNDALPAGKPLLTSHPGASPKGRGGNTLFLPIPYAKHCKVTWEEGDTSDYSRYYQVNYRTYPAGTKVETFSPAILEAAKDVLEQVNRALADPASMSARGKEATHEQVVEPGKDWSIVLPGPAAVRELEIHLGNQDAQALRSLILRGEFDGEETIWCPVGEFCGSGVGLNVLESWYRSVAKDGTMTCRWVMPHKESANLTFKNLGSAAVRMRVTVKTRDWKWDDRSMHFHANWRQQYPLATRPFSDWNYITASGKGVYVGDNLCVMNPVPAWWGEGDEKVWVDGESFPSHFGTGSEDYYCYSWSDPSLFQTPFANQVRCDGPGNKGHTCVTRTRSLDAIPFTKSLKFDMEVWNWADCKVAYAATTYWYGLPGAKSNRGPEPQEAAREIPSVPPTPKIAGAIECEKLKIVAKSENTPVEPQTGALSDGEWSGGAQLFVRGNKPGDFVELAIPAAGTGAKKLTLYATKSWDYGILRFTVNGQPAGKDFDAYSAQVVLSGPIELGKFEPKDGQFLLRVEVVGGNPASKNSKSFFGLDAITLAKP